MYFRYLYNNRKKLKLSDEFYCAVFYFIRDYCYAAMFRYNANGEFNVPYGGISYNRKDFNKKVEFSLCSKEVSTSPLITIEPNANDQAISVSGIAKNSHLYAYIDNNLSSVAEGTLSFIGY